MKLPIELYTDGSSLRNPGASGLGYLIRYWEDSEDYVPDPKVIEGSQAFRLSTNNRMEIMAVLYGMNHILKLMDHGPLEGYGQINLFTDSEYFSKAVSQNWIGKWMSNNWMTSGFGGATPKPVKNKDLWEQVTEIQNKLRNLGITWTITHVKGHADNEYNNRCDQLATTASSSGQNQLIDEGYEATTTINRSSNDWR